MRSPGNPFVTLNGGGPAVAPMGRTFGNYTGGSPQPRIPGPSGSGGEAIAPRGVNFENVDAAIASLHPPGSEHAPHMPDMGQRGGPEPEEAGPAGEAGAEGAAALGAGEGAAGALADTAILGGLL